MAPGFHRSHWKMGPLGVARFLAAAFLDGLANLPAALLLRARYAKARAARRRPGSGIEPTVAWVGDNLDEVNGIALSSRIMLRELRALGRDILMFGVAFHSKPPREEGPDGSIVLAPGCFSMDQAGYKDSEVTLPRLAHFLEFLRSRHVDVVEFQTPGTVSTMCLVACRVIGIPTLSHYRTDIPTYARMLVKNAFGAWWIVFWTRFFTRIAGPVVVPSEAYRAKVLEMGIPARRIHRLPRGVDLHSFHPEKAALGTWRRLGLPAEGVRLLYVGRVSREKNLELLAEAFLRLSAKRPGLSLTVVGDGPYRAAMQASLADAPQARFTGVLQGEDLASVFASADLFVFPSLTDTFGNSVIEALAAGVPCITSGEGGPREIIEDGECGLVFDHARAGDLEAKILALADDPARLAAMRAKARARALQFSYDGAANAFWDFYRRFHRREL